MLSDKRSEKEKISSELSDILDQSDVKLIATWTNLEFIEKSNDYYWIDELINNHYKINVVLWEDRLDFVTPKKYGDGKNIVHSLGVGKVKTISGKTKYSGSIKNDIFTITFSDSNMVIKQIWYEEEFGQSIKRKKNLMYG